MILLKNLKLKKKQSSISVIFENIVINQRYNLKTAAFVFSAI